MEERCRLRLFGYESIFTLLKKPKSAVERTLLRIVEVRSGIANGIFAGYVSPKKIAKMLIFKIYWILRS